MSSLFGGGSQSSTTSVNVPPPTQAELDLQKVNLATAQQLLDNLLQTSSLQSNVLLPLFGEQFGIDFQFDQGTPAVPGGQTVPNPEVVALQQELSGLPKTIGVGVDEGGGFSDEIVNPRIAEIQAKIAELAPTVTADQDAIPATGEITGFSLTPEGQEQLDLTRQVQASQLGLFGDLAEEGRAASGARTEILGNLPGLIDELIGDNGGLDFNLDENLALIDEFSALAIESGESDIRKFAGDALESLRQELAPSLGLRSTDTPILDRGSRVAEEATRQQGQLTRNVRGQAALAKQGVREFQQQLQSQAFVNRLNLASGISNTGLGLQASPVFATSPGSGLGPSAALGLGLSQGGIPGAGLQSSLSQDRLAAASTTKTTRKNSNVIGGLAGLGIGLGSLGFAPFGASALGSAAGSAVASTGFAAGGSGASTALFSSLSSKEFKENNLPIDHTSILEAVKLLPVETWTYRPEMELGTEAHIGPYAEDFRELFGLGDGKTIPIIDMMGVLVSAVKALSNELDTVKRQAPRSA